MAKTIDLSLDNWGEPLAEKALNENYSIDPEIKKEIVALAKKHSKGLLSKLAMNSQFLKFFDLETPSDLRDLKSISDYWQEQGLSQEAASALSKAMFFESRNTAI